MDFPAKLEQQAPPPAQLAEALGVSPKYIGKNQFDYLVEVADEETLLAMQAQPPPAAPDSGARRHRNCKGKEYDFVSRFFAPGSGVDEDPVTGSAHTALAPYWGTRLGKTEMTGFQASARGGVVKVRVAGDRVILSGQAVTILRGQLTDAASRPSLAQTAAQSAIRAPRAVELSGSEDTRTSDSFTGNSCPRRTLLKCSRNLRGLAVPPDSTSGIACSIRGSRCAERNLPR